MTSKSDSQGRYVVTPGVLLERFLIMGSMNSSQFKAGAKFAEFDTPTKASVSTMFKALGSTSMDVFESVVARKAAPKNPPLILALACALAAPETRKRAEALYPQIINTGTDALVLTNYLTELRGKGRSYRRHVGMYFDMLDGMEEDRAALQLVKFRNRAGWTPRDMLRVCHHIPANQERNYLYAFATDKEKKSYVGKNQILDGFESARELGLANANADEYVSLLSQIPNLPWEALPTEALAHAEVWAALQDNLPFTALTRNLGRMSSLGLTISDKALSRLENPPHHVHPVTMLSAWKVYSQGKGELGSKTWRVQAGVSRALEKGFYAAFKNLKPSDKRVFFGMDVSGSMSVYDSVVAGLKCREVACAMAMAAIRQQPYMMYGFSNGIVELNIRHDWELQEVIEYVSKLPFSSTDCALPMKFCTQKSIGGVDLFSIWTDNDTNCSDKPHERLVQYRERFNPNACLAAVALQGRPFTVANPDDWGSMDFVGFDASVPGLLTDLAEKTAPIVV